MSYKVSVGYCVWNEQDNIASVIEDAKKFLDRDFGENQYEVIIVDNCSSDNTREIVKNIIKTLNNFRLIEHAFNKLYAGSNNTILTESQGEYTFTLDGDGQHTAEDIKPFIEKMRQNNWDVIFGWKKTRNDSFARKIVSLGFRCASQILIKNNLHDINCGFRGFNRSAKEQLRLKEKVNSAGPEYLCLAREKKLKYGEFPVRHFPRGGGKGLFNGLVPLVRGIIAFLKYLKRLRSSYLSSM